MHIQKCVTRITIFGLLVMFATPAMAQLGARHFSPYELESLGLEQMWAGQMAINPHRSKLESFSQSISLKDPLVVFEVEHDGRKTSFSANELSPLGDPIGEEGAKALADQFVARLDTRKGEPVVNRIEVPEVTFLARSNSGVLMSMDGRTGKTNWTQTYSSKGYPQPAAAANDKSVYMINDFQLYCLRKSNGEVRWTRKVEGNPIGNPAIGEQFVYVPTAEGTVLAYDFDGGPRLRPRYKSLGRIEEPMIATKTSVAWATNRDYFYVGYADRPLVRYRIEASGQILSSPSSEGPLRLFFTTQTGYVYCIFSTDGAIEWRFSCGQPINTSAIAIRNSVYVTLQRGGLYQLDVADGSVKWFTPRIKQFLAVNDQYVYCLDDDKNMVVLDIATGAPIGRLDLSGYDFYFTNTETDRVILGTTTGRIVVLRSAANPYPMVHVNVEAPAQEKGSPAGAKPDDKGKETKPAADPFAAPPAGGGGGVADPFAAPGGGGSNPFAAPGGGGGASDPFASPAASGGGGAADPFGGSSSDPFGGGSGGGGGMNNDPFGNSGSGTGNTNDPFGN